MANFYDSILEILRQESYKHRSQRKLAIAAGVNPATLSRWISGDRAGIRVSDLATVFDYLGVQLYYPGGDIATEKEMLTMRSELETTKQALKVAQEEQLLLQGEIRGLERRLERAEQAASKV